jgi:hypothetical protein
MTDEAECANALVCSLVIFARSISVLRVDVRAAFSIAISDPLKDLVSEPDDGSAGKSRAPRKATECLPSQ